MQIVKTIAHVREELSQVRQKINRIALVPTMGNLHKGHLSLIKHAQQKADYVAVSVFVNPTQFVAGEDFDGYPRTRDADLFLLEGVDTDLVFMPDTEEIYSSKQPVAEVTVPELDSIYCGKYRPGHFKGVATIVTRLFNIIQPDLACFGEKDFQQLLLIRRLVSSLNVPVEIIGSPTVREADGLAMSSRNKYLNKAERDKAAQLYQQLKTAANKIKNGEKDYKKIENNAVMALEKIGFKPEYFNICDANTLKNIENQNLIIICAAWLGKARLIDNILYVP